MEEGKLIQAHFDEKGKLKAKTQSVAVRLDLPSIFGWQEEVLSSAPVLKMIFAIDYPERVTAAKSRLAARKMREQRAVDERARRSFRRQ